MKKIIVLILSLAILVTSFAGCSDNNKSNDGKVTLKIGVPQGDGLTPYELIERFKAENPDINVVLDESPWNDFKTKLKVQIAGGTAPDVYIMDSGYIATVGAQGAALDLKPFIERDLNADEYINALYSAEDSEGHVWAVPHGINSIALYYNEKIFDDAGMEYPTEDWTFEDMLQAAKKLTGKKQSNGASDVYGLGVGYSITDGWLPFVLASGGTPLNEDRTKSNFNDEKTIEGIRRFASLTQDEIAPPLPWITTKGGLQAAFYSGGLAMAIMNSASANTINKNKSDDFRYNVVSIPYGWDGNRYSVYVPNGWVINAKSDAKKQEAAWKWLKFYLSEESQMLLAEECRGGYPVKKSAIEYCSSVDYIPENREAFYKNIDEHGVTLFENDTWQEWVDAAMKEFKDLYNGVITPEQAAENLHKNISDILK